MQPDSYAVDATSRLSPEALKLLAGRTRGNPDVAAMLVRAAAAPSAQRLSLLRLVEESMDTAASQARRQSDATDL